MTKEKRQDLGKVVFSFEHETKNTYRFRENGEEENYKIGTLYIRKSFFGGAPPKGVEVAITVVE